MASLSKNCANTLERISKLEFDIYRIYEKLTDLEMTRDFNLEYKSKKQDLINQLSVLKTIEDEEFDYFLNHPLDLASALELFKLSENVLITFASENENEDLIIKQRIAENLIAIAQTIEFYSAKGKEANEILYAISFDNFIKSLRTRYILSILSERNKNDLNKSTIEFLSKLFYKNIYLSKAVEDNLISNSFENAKLSFKKEYDALFDQLSDELKEKLDSSILTIVLINVSETISELITSFPSNITTKNILKVKTWLLYISKEDIMAIRDIIIHSPFSNEVVKYYLLINIDDVLKEKQKKKEASPTEFSM